PSPFAQPPISKPLISGRFNPRRRKRGGILLHTQTPFFKTDAPFWAAISSQLFAFKIPDFEYPLLRK
ncbi:hypothetical protein, partial [uncultured Duncaniella sp.]|uniref:hypothetical protein n=1 Tax=uncultured Duncaniella sp. TaxID=2768039 RepID=UPI0025B6A546